jgi:hypothetical protein
MLKHSCLGPISDKGMDSKDPQAKELLRKVQENGGLELRLQTDKKLLYTAFTTNTNRSKHRENAKNT